MQYGFLQVFLCVVCVIGLAIGLAVVAILFNPGRPGRITRMPYESGMDPIHDTRRRFDVRFHLLAIAFLVFDVELLFLYPWAVASRPAEVEVREERGEGRGMGTSVPIEVGSGSIIAPEKLQHQQDFATSLSPLPSPLSSLQGIDAAVAAGTIESRHLVFGGAMTFVILLALGFVYDWRKGVFQWR